MLDSYDITFIQGVVQRIYIVINTVYYKIVLEETDLLYLAGVVIVIAAYKTVDIQKSRGSTENDIENGHKSKYDREKVSNDMLGLLPLIASGADAGKDDKYRRQQNMHCQIHNKITHKNIFTPRILLQVSPQ